MTRQTEIEPERRVLWAGYRAQGGAIYTDDDHTGCLFAARSAGEPEVQWFPHEDPPDDEAYENILARMGFVARNGEWLARHEALERIGADLAEDIDMLAARTPEDRPHE